MADKSPRNVHNILLTEKTAKNYNNLIIGFTMLLAGQQMSEMNELMKSYDDDDLKNIFGISINNQIASINTEETQNNDPDNIKNIRIMLLKLYQICTMFLIIANIKEPPAMRTIKVIISTRMYIIELTDKQIVPLTHNKAMAYDTIINIINSIASECGEPISLHYDDSEALYLALTTNVFTTNYKFGLLLRIIKAIDFLGSDNILNGVLVKLGLIFQQKKFLATISPMKNKVQELLMGLPETIIHRFFELVNIPVIEYTSQIDDYSRRLIVSDDLNRFVVVEFITDLMSNDMIRYKMYNNGLYCRRFTISNEHCTNRSISKWALSNDGNLYAATIDMNVSNKLTDNETDIAMGNGTVYEYCDEDDYTEHVAVIMEDRAAIIQNISQDTKRCTVMYHLTNDEVTYEVRERAVGQHFSSDDRVLSTITLPHLQHEHHSITIVHGVYVGNNPTKMTKLPCASPLMKIIIYQSPEDLKTAKYRILCPDTNSTAIINFSDKPYIISDDGNPNLPQGIEKLPIDMIGSNRISTSLLSYVLYSHDEKKFAIVFRCMKKYEHIILIYSLTGIFLQYYIFNKEVPIALGNNYIITIDSIYHVINLVSYRRLVDNVVKPADDTDVHIKIWSTINPEKNILLYKTKIDLSMAPNATWHTSNIWTGANDSLLIEYDYFIPGQPRKKILQKYTIKSYDGIKSFVEDKLS